MELARAAEGDAGDRFIVTEAERQVAGLRRAPLHLAVPIEGEWAAEIANRTMHGVMHLGWLRDETGGYRGQMAVYVKPNGLVGTA